MKDKIIKQVSTVFMAPMYAFCGILIFFGGVSAFSSIGLLSSNLQLVWQGNQAVGTVVVDQEGDANAVVINPLVEFTMPDGKVIRGRSNFSTDIVTYRDGEKVEVLYAGDNPRSFSINTVYHLWLLPFIFLSMGSLFAAVGGYKIYQMRNRTTNITDKAERRITSKERKIFNRNYAGVIILLMIGFMIMIAGGASVYEQYQLFLIDYTGESALKDFTNDGRNGSAFLFLAGLIVAGVGAVTIIYWFIIERRRTKLIINGRKITGEVIDLEYANTRANNVRGRIIVVQYCEDDLCSDFKSQPFYILDIERYIRQGDKVDIYVDPANTKRYFVDVKNFTPAD